MHIKEVVNPGVFRDTFYRYDLAGRHIRETTVQDEVTYQDNFIAYDALGRMRWIADARAAITIDYDAVGKRTHIHTHVNDLVAEDTDRYYQYDAMNRQTVVDAVDAAGNLGATGHRLTYDANGNRTSDTHNGLRLVEAGGPGSGLWAAQAGETQEVYGYDALGRLETTDRDGVRVDRRTYDAANRVISSGPEALPAAYMALHRMHMGTTGNDPLQGRRNEYDANGWLRHQDTFEYGVSLTGVNYDYDDVGNVVKTLAVPVEADPEKRAFTTTTYELTRFEGYQVVNSVSATRKTADEYDVPQSLAGLAYAYDVNGHLISTGDAGQITHPTLRTHNFVNDAAGNALYASYSAEGAGQHEHAQRQLVVNGEVLGRYGEVADQRFEGFPIPQFKDEAQFSFGYQPINGSYPAGSPGTYAVAAGDTLKSIAKGAYGDANQWYLIADANGLSSDADLRTGQVLTIPTRVSSANNASTFKPYDPTRIANDTATMMAMPQGHGGGCGGVGQVIMVVVAVVVAYYTAGALSGPLSAALGGEAAGAVAAGAVGGAAGSVASQGVGIAIGAQDSFSWKGVALGAIAGGAAGGIGGVQGLDGVRVGGIAGLNGAGPGAAIVRGALTNAATQGVAVAVGLQKGFDWRGVAAAAVGAGVGQAVAGPLSDALGHSGLGDFAARALTGLAAGAAVAAMRGGRINATQVALDAFGNALGDSIAAANGQKTQGVGPWSDSGYENGSDVQDSIAAANRGRAGAQVFNEPGWGRVPGSAGYAYGLGDNGITNWQGNAAAKAEQSASLERVARSELGKGPGASNEDAFVGEVNAQRDLNMSVARRAANTAYNGDSAMASYQLLGGGPGDSALRVNGLTFSQDMALRQVGNNPYGLPTSSVSPANTPMSIASDSRVVRDFDPDNKWDPEGLVPVGVDGSPIAQVGRGTTGLPTSSRAPAPQAAAVPLTAADWNQQAKRLSKDSDQLFSAAEWARNNGMPEKADQYQQAANKAYYAGQTASMQAINMNVESSRNIPPPTSTNPFASGWNTGEYSAGTPYASGSRAPDYVSIQLNAYVASAGVAIDLHDGGVYGQWALGRQYPAYTAKPGLSIVAGSIAGGVGAGDTAEFLKGGSWAAGAFAPSPVPLIGFGGGVNHSYGGKTAIEIGVSVPPGAGVNPAGYGFELKNFKAK